MASAYLSKGLSLANAAVDKAKTNPAAAGAAVVGTTGLVAVAAPAVFIVPVIAGLHGVGFGAGGVVGGTMAASAQAAIGNVVAPSVFATLTSAGAGGYGIATIAGVGQGIGGAMAASGAAGIWLMRGKDDAAEPGLDAKDLASETEDPAAGEEDTAPGEEGIDRDHPAQLQSKKSRKSRL